VWYYNGLPLNEKISFEMVLFRIEAQKRSQQNRIMKSFFTSSCRSQPWLWRCLLISSACSCVPSSVCGKVSTTAPSICVEPDDSAVRSSCSSLNCRRSERTRSSCLRRTAFWSRKRLLRPLWFCTSSPTAPWRWLCWRLLCRDAGRPQPFACAVQQNIVGVKCDMQKIPQCLQL